jgi:hypothetical protein
MLHRFARTSLHLVLRHCRQAVNENTSRASPGVRSRGSTAESE